MEDVVALLDKIEVTEVELAPALRIDGPGVEVSAIGEVVVDQAGEDPGHEGVTVAMALQKVLNIL